MFSKKKFILITKINCLIVVFLVLLRVMPVTLSKYQSSGVGNLNSNIAFYLLETTYEIEQIKLGDIIPRNEPYVFNFTIGNQNDKRVSEVDIEYDLKVVTTTNLPLRFELYKNSNGIINGNNNLILSNKTFVAKDEYGTYFKTFEIESGELYYSNPSTNSYMLLVYFDKKNNDSKYQGMVESIKIIIDSRQIIDM